MQEVLEVIFQEQQEVVMEGQVKTLHHILEQLLGTMDGLEEVEEDKRI